LSPISPINFSQLDVIMIYLCCCSLNLGKVNFIRVISFLVIVFLFHPAFSQMPDKHLFLSPDFFSLSSNPSQNQAELDSWPIEGIDSLFKNRNLGIHLFQKDSTWVAWQDCGLNLFVYEEGAWKNLYQYANFGHTCGGNLLWLEDDFFLLGGKTDFFFHSDYLQFFQQFGSWEFSFKSQQPLNYQSSWIGVNSNGIFSFFGDYFSKPEQIQEKELEGYFLDFENNKWNKLKFSWTENRKTWIDQEMIFSLDLQDYSMAVFPQYTLIFDKNSMQLSSIDPEQLTILDQPYFYKVEGNLFTWISDGSFVSVDLSKLIVDSQLIAEISIVPQPEELAPKFRIQNLLIILAFFLIFSASSFWFYKTRLAKKEAQSQSPMDVGSSVESIPVDPIQALITNLKQSDKEYFTTEELDQILEIQEIESLDNRRVKRSRLIKSLNEYSTSHWGKPIITRERQPEDKRYFRFRIVFSNDLKDSV
jgi:hypothetical protein